MGQIDKFRAAMASAKGFARPSKFAVKINPPNQLRSVPTYTANGQEISTENTEFLKSRRALMEMNNSMRGQINLFCSSIEMPGHDLQTQQIQHGSAPVRDMVTSHAFEGMITASFYLSEDLKERHFFEQWQRMAVNVESHKANFYDDYIGSMEIFQLDGNGEITYGIKATEVYPTTIAGIEYAYANANQIATQAVQFQYRQWFNLTSDTIAGYKGANLFDLELKFYGI